MIRRYKSNLISFVYPENWKLTDSEQDVLPREIAVESPDGPLWVVHAFDPNSDPAELMKEAIATFQQNYQDFESEELKSVGDLAPARAIQADFFCLDFLVTARIMIFTSTPLTYMVIQQAESRQFDASCPVFDAITTSLVCPETVAEETDSVGD